MGIPENLGKIKTKHVDSSQFENWPLSCDSGYIVLRTDLNAVCFIDELGRMYALNGNARQIVIPNIQDVYWHETDESRKAKIRFIIGQTIGLIPQDEKYNPVYPDLGELIEFGLNL